MKGSTLTERTLRLRKLADRSGGEESKVRRPRDGKLVWPSAGIKVATAPQQFDFNTKFMTDLMLEGYATRDAESFTIHDVDNDVVWDLAPTDRPDVFSGTLRQEGNA